MVIAIQYKGGCLIAYEIDTIKLVAEETKYIYETSDKAKELILVTRTQGSINVDLDNIISLYLNGWKVLLNMSDLHEAIVDLTSTSSKVIVDLETAIDNKECNRY